MIIMTFTFSDDDIQLVKRSLEFTLKNIAYGPVLMRQTRALFKELE